MASRLTSLGIDKLPREDRLALVQEIWDTIASEPAQSMLTDVQRIELERRVAEDDKSPDEVIPWEQVKARTLARLRKP
jgi:putative addiction module component (TIGR02574 family)